MSVVIQNVDMCKEMQEDAIALATHALEKYNNSNKMVNYFEHNSHRSMDLANILFRRTLPHSSRRNLTENTTQTGIALLAMTLDHS